MKNTTDITSNEIDTFYKEIGKRVSQVRAEKSLTQSQLAELLDFNSVGTISNCEIYYKKNHFNLKHLFLISQKLNISIYKLIPETV